MAEAIAEHASIASFARFLLKLLALGAPADLVADAQTAIDDERRHAEAAFGWASNFADRPMGPSQLDVADALGPVERRSVALGTAAEGAIAATYLRPSSSKPAARPATRACAPTSRRWPRRSKLTPCSHDGRCAACSRRM